MANPLVLRFQSSTRRGLLLAYTAFAVGFTVCGAASSAQAQITDFNVSASSMAAYTINGATNPSLGLQRGHIYRFIVNSPGHPFYIKTAQVLGNASAYNDGVDNNGTDSGTIVFIVPPHAPAGLFYQCSVHTPMTGALAISGTALVPDLPPWAWLLLLASLLATGVIATRKQTMRALVS